MMPVLAVLALGVAVYSVTRPGALDGVKYYLIPDFSRFSPMTVLAAMGQLFYSMSLAMGIMVTYGSYMKKEDDLEKSVKQIELFDTGMAFVAGMMIVPAVFAFSGGDEAALNKGAGLMFVTLPKVFADAGTLGLIFGGVFFVLVLFAALTSSVSLMETVVSIFQDKFHWSRKFTCTLVMVGCLLLALPSSPVSYTHLNFGSPNPEGYRKALRLMKQADKFHRPVVCFVDTSGAFGGLGAEERGQGQAIAENLVEMMDLQTPVISILIGEGGSGGALALAVADQVWILENAVYSVISPEGCASILWKDAKKVKEAAECLKLTAQDMEKLGVVERVIPEEKDFGLIYDRIKTALLETLPDLQTLPADELLQRRYERFRKF